MTEREAESQQKALSLSPRTKLGQSRPRSPSGLPTEGCLPVGRQGPWSHVRCLAEGSASAERAGACTMGPMPGFLIPAPRGGRHGGRLTLVGWSARPGRAWGITACPSKSLSKSRVHLRHVQNPTCRVENFRDQPPSWAPCQGLSPEKGLRSGSRVCVSVGSVCSRGPLSTRVYV